MSSSNKTSGHKRTVSYNPHKKETMKLLEPVAQRLKANYNGKIPLPVNFFET